MGDRKPAPVFGAYSARRFYDEPFCRQDEVWILRASAVVKRWHAGQVFTWH